MTTSPHEYYLDFESPVLDVVTRLRELSDLKKGGKGGEDLPEKNLEEEIARLQVKEKRVIRLLYRNLTPWQKVLVARHPSRPQPQDYIHTLVAGFIPLCGDRLGGEDPALLAGLGTFNGRPVAALGTCKGKNTQERMKFNFGMPKPEGYRKAQRIMKMAEKFGLPLLTFVDTPGAYPGVEAEARGQAEAIAKSIETLLGLKVPVVAVITGEGGSGGALALATADRVLMLEHAVYSVISPEGCASILWPGEEPKEAVPQAAESLKLTAQDLQKLKVIDDIIKEPVGAAHRGPELAFERVGSAIAEALAGLEAESESDRAASRRRKFLAMTEPVQKT